MASVVLQGLFPPRLDSPLVQSRNDAWMLEDSEASDEFEILEHVTSTLAVGFTRLITTLDSTVAELEMNETVGEAEEHLIHFIGWFFRPLGFCRIFIDCIMGTLQHEPEARPKYFVGWHTEHLVP